jgi:hypothetical protein
MDFLKKHYEKVLLGVMLAGLIGVLVFMLFYIAADQDDMRKKRDTYINPHVKVLTNLDMTVQDSAILRLKSPYVLDFETSNKLLNPMEWQRALDNTLIPSAKKTGLQVAVVTNIAPLFLVISLVSSTTNELGARYVISVERQAATTPAKRHPAQHFVSPGDKANDTFALLEVKGPADNPDALVLKLVDGGEVVTVSHDKPYRRVDGYAADFRYDPERKVFRGRRTGDKVSFGGVDYVVVDVNQSELILSDQSNQKKTPLRFVP